MRFGAVVVAAGSGRRFATDGVPKQYRNLAGKPLLRWALDAFLDHPAIAVTVVVLPSEDVHSPPDWLRDLDVIRVAGGAQRADSVRRGVEAVGELPDVVLVHDGARPMLSRDLLDRVLAASREGPTVPGLPVTDTLKQVGADGIIESTPDRERLWAVQTPQAFPTTLLLECHLRAAEEGFHATDDAALLERYGHRVRIVEGEAINLKVTTQTDLILAELLAQRLPSHAKSSSCVEDPTS